MTHRWMVRAIAVGFLLASSAAYADGNVNVFFGRRDLDQNKWRLSQNISGLEKQDDFVLLDVSGDREKVRVEKRGAVLLVSVDSAEESVRLEIPLASITRMARWLGTAAPAAQSPRVGGG